MAPAWPPGTTPAWMLWVTAWTEEKGGQPRASKKVNELQVAGGHKTRNQAKPFSHPEECPVSVQPQDRAGTSTLCSVS